MSINSYGAVKKLRAEKINIYRDSSGILKVKIEGEEGHPIKPIRCFPLTEADRSLGLFKIESEGIIKEEIALIFDFMKLDENSRRLIEEELNKSYPLTRITKIYSVEQTPQTWRWLVDTDKGRQTFEVRHQKDIYLIQPSLVVIKDVQGNTYLISLAKLDSRSLSLLEIYK